MAAAPWPLLVLAVLLLASAVHGLGSGSRHLRYAEFDPPRILPDADYQTVKSGDSYTFRCEGTDRGVSWRLPVDATDDLRSRVRLVHSSSVLRQRDVAERMTLHVAQLTIRYSTCKSGHSSGQEGRGTSCKDNRDENSLADRGSGLGKTPQAREFSPKCNQCSAS